MGFSALQHERSWRGGHTPATNEGGFYASTLLRLFGAARPPQRRKQVIRRRHGFSSSPVCSPRVRERFCGLFCGIRASWELRSYNCTPPFSAERGRPPSSAPFPSISLLNGISSAPPAAPSARRMTLGESSWSCWERDPRRRRAAERRRGRGSDYGILEYPVAPHSLSPKPANTNEM